jgi:regulatory protein
MQQEQLTPGQALPKIKQYCAYQERSHSEIKDKLYGFGLRKNEVEEILATLIEENYCNEERFAEQFAGGKFRMKQWGRIKIRRALQEKRVSEFSIKKALLQIDGDEYEKTIGKLAEAKWKSLSRERNIFMKMAKARDYLLQKGFESDLATQAISKLRNSTSED